MWGAIRVHFVFLHHGGQLAVCAMRRAPVLSTLRDKYPELRVYSFDYSTDLSAVTAMLQIYKIKDTALPALVIDDDVLTGFHSIEEVEAMVKESFKLQQTAPKATTSDTGN